MNQDTAGQVDIDVEDGGREVNEEEQANLPSSPDVAQVLAPVATVLTKLQKWGDYAAYGKPLHPTKFIPTKTPLSEEIISHWSVPGSPNGPKHRLTVMDLLTAQEQAGRKVGMILDLSNHDCLYTADIPSDIHYEHIKLVAKELPPPEFVAQVCARANHFWSQHPDEYIGIHCAYGFNRTGFVLCCYLISQLGMSVDEALETFQTSRPPGVKHREFRNELRARYEPGTPLEPPGPQPAKHNGPSSASVSDPSSSSVTTTATITTSTTTSTAQCGDPAKGAATTASSSSNKGGLHGGAGAGSAGSQQGVGLGARASSSAGGSCGEGVCGATVESTPAGQKLVQATPTTENDSLGADQRAVLEGLRANGLLGGSPKPITPTQLDSLLAAAAQSPCQTVQKPRGPGLQRRSIGDIDWGTGTDSTHSPARTQHQEPHRQAHRDKPQSGHKGLSASVADPGVHQQLESLRLTE